MTRRVVIALLLLILLPAWARGEAGSGIRCVENRPACRLLQMVMAGSFDADDPEDAVLERVLASVSPRLRAVGEEDIAHFAAEFGEDIEATRLRYYRALANCLRAEIEAEALPESRLSPAQRVLLLFLDGGEGANAEAQRAQIRLELTDEAVKRVCEGANVPEGFVRWLMDVPQ